ncbi:MAG: ATP-binding protein [Euryarchaeota archaeon HGW-Euryarchaeota-1]|nr:MAG: ATP-binding protein [Euryarchaeota archaeon HGW-Euryarchaeota-1]
MTRGELLRKLFKSYVSNDDHSFRAVALEIIAEEQQKQNHALARDLLELLETQTPSPKKTNNSGFFEIPKEKQQQFQLVELKQPIHGLTDIILKDKTREQINRIILEYNKSEVLKIHGLKPKKRILLCGPSGCGKSLSAEVIATELKLPLLYTRFDAIISSYLGETATNLRKVFDYAKSGRWVILFDEFDSIGKSRNSPQDHGEMQRVVNSFLQIIDNFEGDSIIIAATNNPSILDSALWRRFDEIIIFEKPNLQEIKLLLHLKLKNFPIDKVNINEISKKVQGLSYAEIERVCLDAIKTAILEDKDAVNQDIFLTSIEKQKNRKIIQNTKTLFK